MQTQTLERHALVAFVFLVAMIYTIASAISATGGGDTFASGHWANWLFTKVLAAHDFFWCCVAPGLPG
ncbi:MAG: hypothetical protein WAV46_00240 [Candidatus Moraniibacteriota bacterium]